MHFYEYILMALIFGGAVWMVFRSLFKEGQISCPDCTAEGCAVKELKMKAIKRKKLIESKIKDSTIKI